MRRLSRSAARFVLHPDPLVREVAQGYAAGGFLMDEGAGPQWFTVPRRAVVPMPLPGSRRLRRSASQFEVRLNADFAGTVAGCRGRLPGSPQRDGEWISDDMAALYGKLRRAGLAHSFEVWRGGELAGGVLGLAIGGVFFAESKFHRVTDASKVALLRLSEALPGCGFTLLDAQVQNPHLARLGVREVSAAAYAPLLQEALMAEATLALGSTATNPHDVER